MVDNPRIAVTDSQINCFFKSQSCTPWITPRASEWSLYTVNPCLKQFSSFSICYNDFTLCFSKKKIIIIKNLSESAVEPINFRRKSLNLDN